MSSLQLLFHRIRENWEYKYKIIQSVIDWTVLVYIVIPAVIIAAFIYRSWWMEAPGWIEFVPFPLLFAICFFILWGGHFKTYVREADIIFLRKNERLMLGMKKGGILLSYLFESLTAVCLGLLIAPLWFHFYGLNTAQLLLFISLWMSLKCLLMGISGQLNVHARGFQNLIRRVPVFIGAAAIWWISYQVFETGHLLFGFFIIIFNMILSIFLVRRRFTSLHTFEQDLAIDEKDKSKMTEMIFGMSMDMEKLPKPKTIRKSPRLYSKSNRLFQKRTQVNGFLELFIKATTRDTEYLRGYLQILGVTSAAIIVVPPLWLKISMGLAGFLFLLVWIGSVWNKLIGSHPFTKKYIGKEGYVKGKNRVTIILLIPFAIIGCLNIWLAQMIRSFYPF